MVLEGRECDTWNCSADLRLGSVLGTALWKHTQISVGLRRFRGDSLRSRA